MWEEGVMYNWVWAQVEAQGLELKLGSFGVGTELGSVQEQYLLLTVCHLSSPNKAFKV